MGRELTGPQGQYKRDKERILFSTVQDKQREVAWKKKEEKPHFTLTVVNRNIGNYFNQVSGTGYYNEF